MSIIKQRRSPIGNQKKNRAINDDLLCDVLKFEYPLKYTQTTKSSDPIELGAGALILTVSKTLMNIVSSFKILTY